ncbi:manganese and iron superoxide dismutase [Decorospora gaudefroyi]|uniref:Manganese and iron superoxide dismutase n=1 Tax=Decorospora gaudefroyi TaxID=184978 RepID=A0A6A5KXA4_9PLEO|nr:manganese and iron superoxide dismutase [Decorospora gaudefroyi]
MQAEARAVAGAWRRMRTPCRARHWVPTLERHAELEQHGIPGLLDAAAFKTAYTDYQQLMVDELNAFTVGKPDQQQETKALVIEFARDPTKAHGFNVASMAWNNHFFFRGLNTRPNVQSRPSTDLQHQINKDFSSTDTLRQTLLDTADAMFGPGFVWLVQTNDSEFGNLRILPTYLAGSPLSGAHYRRQSHNLNTHNPDSYHALNKVGSFGPTARPNHAPAARQPLGGVDVVPLLCVDTWEHVWLQQYGIRGKRAFLEKWWDRIDWDMVAQNMTRSPRPGQGTRQPQFLY